MSLEPRSTPAGPSVPPLRIHHLMVWMTVTAALISVCLWFDRTARNGPGITNPVIIVALILCAIAVSLSFTVVGCGFYWRQQGCRFPREPGDLLVLMAAGGALFFIGMVLGIFAVFFMIGDDDWQPIYYFVVTLMGAIGWIRMSARGYTRFADSTPWRLAYVMMLGAPALMGSMVFMGTLTAMPLAALIASLSGAAGSDWRNGIHRAWTHWVGVFVAISLLLAIIGLVDG
jgi:hypothetical protein